jgi:hypothetical protein
VKQSPNVGPPFFETFPSDSPLSLDNRLLIYKAILKPAWIYGIELWGCASPSNLAKILRYQSKLLRIITNAPWFVTNQTLHQDLCIEELRNVFREKHILNIAIRSWDR